MNAQNSCRSFLWTNCSQAREKSSSLNGITRAKSTYSAGNDCGPPISDESISPSSAITSGLISRGLSANADRLWYGLLSYAESVGFSGRICQYFCRVLSRKSANLYAAGPRSPIPYLDGNDDICRSIPLPRTFMVSHQKPCISSCAFLCTAYQPLPSFLAEFRTRDAIFTHFGSG